jgi:hypothetical protein
MYGITSLWPYGQHSLVPWFVLLHFGIFRFGTMSFVIKKQTIFWRLVGSIEVLKRTLIVCLRGSSSFFFFSASLCIPILGIYNTLVCFESTTLSILVQLLLFFCTFLYYFISYYFVMFFPIF